MNCEPRIPFGRAGNAFFFFNKLNADSNGGSSRHDEYDLLYGAPLGNATRVGGTPLVGVWEREFANAHVWVDEACPPFSNVLHLNLKPRGPAFRELLQWMAHHLAVALGHGGENVATDAHDMLVRGVRRHRGDDGGQDAPLRRRHPHRALRLNQRRAMLRLGLEFNE